MSGNWGYEAWPLRQVGDNMLANCHLPINDKVRKLPDDYIKIKLD